MKEVEQYLLELLGIEAHVYPFEEQELKTMPYYRTSTFRFYNVSIYNNEFIMVDVQHYPFNIAQINQQLNIIRKDFNKKIILVVKHIDPLERKRLIEAGTNFIMPGYQLFLPDLLINLNENKRNIRRRITPEKLLPSAQIILLYYLLHPREKKKIEEYTFKELAKKFNYTQMAITKAVDNLVSLELCEVKGTKEKYINFKNTEGLELWGTAKEYLVNPVLKRVFVDVKPEIYLYQCNASALPEYTDMNPVKQQYYAIDKNDFFELQKANALINLNEREGKYCLEVWKYNPKTLTEEASVEREEEIGAVDPLSLYLSLKDAHDERVEMATEQLLEKVLW